MHKSSEKLGFGVGVSFRVRVSCVSDALANMKNSTNALISNNSEKKTAAGNSPTNLVEAKLIVAP